MNDEVEQTIRDYLPGVLHMSLATSKDNKPWVCEVHFVYDDQLNLYFRSLATRRHSQEIAVNPNVSGNIIKQHALGEYPLGVYFEGTATIMQSGPDQDKAFTYFKDRLQVDESILEDAARPDGHKFYKITISNWYVFGKLGDRPGQKYQLKWNGGQK